MKSSPNSLKMILDISSAISSPFDPFASNAFQDLDNVSKSFLSEKISSSTTAGILQSRKR